MTGETFSHPSVPLPRKREAVFDSKVENCDLVTRFIEEAFEEESWRSEKERDDFFRKLALLTEEIFSNIAFYAYGEKKGKIRIQTWFDSGKFWIRFIDSGRPYNPLDRKDPDVTLPAEKRPIGGLGIFLVKKLSDAIDYHRDEGRNILTVGLRFDRNKEEID